MGVSLQETNNLEGTLLSKPPLFKNRIKSFIYYSLLIITILLGYLFSDHTIGTSVALKRQIYLGDTATQLSKETTFSALPETWSRYLNELNNLVPLEEN